MEFVSLVITPVIKSVMEHVKKHLGFLVYSKKNVKDMDASRKQLNDAAGDVQRSLDMAVVHTLVVPKGVESWLEEIKILNESTKSIQEPGTGCFNLSKRYKTGKRSSYILKEIEKLKSRKLEIEFPNEKISLARVTSTSIQPSSSALAPDGTSQNHIFVSRDLLFKDALKALQSSNESENMIALCGMGGIGKTTMMEQLKKVAEDSRMFDWIVKVVLGENHDPIALQQATAERIGENLDETTKDARADRLRKMFEGMSKQGKTKILVIMDDVWEKVNLQHIGLAKPFPNGFKLLFTSRFKDICTQMGVKTGSIFEVRVLDEEEAKTLFFKIVGQCDDLELQKIGEDIVKKCRGLPIAIVTIANVLHSNIKDKWQEVLFNLQKHDLQDLDDIVNKVFTMSYNNLKKEDDKAVFILGGLFPEDYSIPIEELMMYAWGLKLFTNVHTLVEARRRTNICVNNLIRANLLIESELIGYVKMHDLVRAFVLSNFLKAKQASTVNHDDMALKIFTEDERKIPAYITNHDSLSLLILKHGNNFLKFPKDLLKKFEKLQVVSFEGMYIPSLPEMFVHSSKLRTLCLRSCSLVNDDISFIGSLSNLETLSIADCGLSRLPSAIGKLKNLKSLDLTGCIDLCIEDGVLKNLESLEELYMRSGSLYKIEFTYANCEELKILSERLFALELEFYKNNAQPKHVSFKNLIRFRISIGCLLGDLKKRPFRNTLYLVADSDELKECNIIDLFEKTEELYLACNDMNHLQDVSMHHPFFNLRDLHVSGCENLTYLFTYDVAGGLKQLERLKVSYCPVLRTLVSEKLGVIRFPKLSFISLFYLPEMVGLCDDVIELPGMVELELQGLTNFTSIYYDDSNNICAVQSLLNEGVLIPKLETLHICSMENLKQLWPCQISTAEKNSVSMLKKIIIRECDSLVNLFPTNPLPLLNHLDVIKVVDCDSLEVLFNIDFEHVREMEGYSSRLRSIKVNNSNMLKELWRMRGVNNSDIHINGFQSVETINIKFCKRFTNLFTPSATNFDLGALTTYNAFRVREQNAQVNGVSWSFCQYPRKIKVDECNALGSLVPWYAVGQMKKLEELELRSCKGMTEVFESESITYNTNDVNEGSASDVAANIIDIMFTSPTLKNITTVVVPQLINLKSVSIYKCDLLQHIFTLSTLESLKQLKDLHVSSCKVLRVIVNKEKGASSKVVVFPCLEIIQLEYLPNLKGFFMGVNDIHWPSLENVMIKDCPQLIMFTSGKSETKKLKYISKDFGKYCVESCGRNSQTAASSDATILKGLPLSFHNLTEINLLCTYDGTFIIPSHALLQLQKLEIIHLISNKSVQEVFEVQLEGKNNSSFNESKTTIVPISNLTQMSLWELCDLKYLWKRSHWMVLEFPNLTTLSISKCDKLEHVFTCSMVGSLLQLEDLYIAHCKNIEVIVKEEEEEECDAKVNEIIMLPRLNSLTLYGLSSLKRFCISNDGFSLPALNNLSIKTCPEILDFTKGHVFTPELKVIETSFGLYDVGGDINSFIKTKQEEGILKQDSEEYNLSPYLWASGINMYLSPDSQMDLCQDS